METQILEGPIGRPESRADLILDHVGGVAVNGDYSDGMHVAQADLYQCSRLVVFRGEVRGNAVRVLDDVRSNRRQRESRFSLYNLLLLPDHYIQRGRDEGNVRDVEASFAFNLRDYQSK